MITDEDWSQFFVESEDYATLTVKQSTVSTVSPPPTVAPIPPAPTANPIDIDPSKYESSPQTVNFVLKELNPANIKVGEKIAEGFFGIVYAGNLLNTDIAIKSIKKDFIQNVEKELKLIQ